MKLRPRPVDAALFIAVVFVLYLASSPTPLQSYWPTSISHGLRCSPEAYSAGRWERQPGILRNMTRHEDVFALSGWTRCASSQEPGWHLASDVPEAFHWRTEASMARWKWIPGPACSRFRRFSGEEMVRNLVERGGWLMIGDSLTEGHFFSLSCILHPHVRAEPLYRPGESFYRAWAQSLYLLPTSPLARTLRFPPGFDIEQTPLATFRRVDAILAPEELLPLYARVAPDRVKSDNPDPEALYGNLQEALFNLDSSEVLALFTSPPPLNFGTLIISTGAHWTQSVFGALHGYEEILEFLGHTARLWLERVAEALKPVASPKWSTAQRWLPKTSAGYKRRVVVRSANWGSEDCMTEAVRMGGAVDEVPVLKQNKYNWDWITKMNDMFEKVVKEFDHPLVHYLGIERPCLMRPDAHVLPDCLHIAAGTGAMETWTEYIAHFLWSEDP
ncbi:hypothetical protein AURDEDRAFT_90398 [Auricularia subglabra TFB-10046 SS5]|nr:hypothetical protein AURDEDRAFT_90398 [Auricularia subglabra TFB-10046 SS5]